LLDINNEISSVHIFTKEIQSLTNGFNRYRKWFHPYYSNIEYAFVLKRFEL